MTIRHVGTEALRLPLRGGLRPRTQGLSAGHGELGRGHGEMGSMSTTRGGELPQKLKGRYDRPEDELIFVVKSSGSGEELSQHQHCIISKVGRGQGKLCSSSALSLQRAVLKLQGDGIVSARSPAEVGFILADLGHMEMERGAR